MSERERWIVYPLIFFALGAAIRDKLLQRIETREVVCESVTILDLQNPGQPLAELAFRRGNPADPTQLTDRVGTLQLADGMGTIICQFRDEAYVERLQTRQLEVVDPHDHTVLHAGSEPVVDPGTIGEDQPPTFSHQGVVYLNNQPVAVTQPPDPPQEADPQEP